MKIACSSTSDIPSDTANSIQVLMACQGLSENGHEISLSIPGNPHSNVDFDALRKPYALHCPTFTIRYFRSRKNWRRLDFAFSALLSALREKADCVYTWTIQIAVLAALLGKPSFFEVHAIPDGQIGQIWLNLYARIKAPKTYVLITHALKKQMQARYPAIREAECVIAPNAISICDYENLPDIRNAKIALGCDPEKILITCSGHLYAGRGAELFIQLAEAVPQAQFYWFGGTPQAVIAYQNASAQNGLTNVRFCGFIQKCDLPACQAASDILLMPYSSQIAGSSGGDSATFCSPMKLFEYLAIGRAIVSTDLPVLREVIDDSSARFCRADDVTDWSATLRKLIANPQMRADLGAAAKRLSARYTWQKRAEAVLCPIRNEE